MAEWPEPVQRVASVLKEAGAEGRLEQFPAGTSTAEDAAHAVGCSLAQIVKTLVFACDGRVVVVLVPGERRADAEKVAREVGAAKARVAGRAEVEEATGFGPGAVAPFPLPDVDTVLVDRGVLVHDRVWVGAGSPSHVLGIAPAELVRLARAKPVDAVQGGA